METQAGFLLSQIKQIGGRVFERILAQENVSEFNGAQGKILYVLWHEDGIPMSELSQRVGLANTTLTSMLDRMEEAGLTRRLPDRLDRRKHRIVLTEKAQGLREKYELVSQEMNEVYYRGFREEEIEEFERYLHRILRNIKEEL